MTLRLIHLLMIATVVACPLACWTGGPACCVDPADTNRGASDCCDDCCRPDQSGRDTCPGGECPRGGDCPCLCAGAVVVRPTLELVDSPLTLLDTAAVLSCVVCPLHDAASHGWRPPDDSAARSGRALRTICCSLLC